MTLVRGQNRLAHRPRASEAPTGLSSIRSNNDHKDPLGSNKPGPPKAPPEPPEAFPGPSQAPSPHDPDANCYSQRDLDRII